jgi:PEP-CTERM motif
MTRISKVAAARVLLTLGLVAVAGPSETRAALVIANGSFEAGLTGWTVANSLGSDGSFFLQSGTTSPINGDPVSAPSAGIRAAMSDAQGPGSHVLYQDFVVPTVLNPSDSLIKFDLFIGNRGPFFATPSPPSLDFGINAFNQQVRVDLIKASADPFSVSTSDVVQNLYQSKAGDPLVSGYTTFDINVRNSLLANTGQTLRLRFAEVDNMGALQLGVDNVSFQGVPEPSSLLMAGLGLGLCLGYGHFKARCPRRTG